jgi:isochorismate synthase
MDTIFTTTPRGKHASWAGEYDHELLFSALRRASSDAAHLGRAVLASVTQPVDIADPLRLVRAFESLHMGDCIFWAQPSEHRVLVGVGAAATIETSGSARCTTAATTWRTLLHDAVVCHAPAAAYDQGGPILLGGFSFDPLRLHTSLWDGFPDGLLILPQFLLHFHGEQCVLTVNRMVQASDDSQRCSHEIMQQLQSLRAALESMEPDQQATSAQLVARDVLPAQEWKELVARTVRKIQQGFYEKVVLARSVEATRTGTPFEIAQTLARLCEGYPGAYVFAFQRGSRCFVGATPERLVRAQHGQLQAMALAGSTPRGASAEEDAHLGTELLQSAKNRVEHAIVVSTIRDALAHACSKVWVADTPHLRRLKNIQHLETAIVGELLPGRCILEAIAGLFPTPAVGGVPRESALALLRAEEQLDRGWYAGAIGCIDASGNGEFAVALRSALVDGDKAMLFGGCGIVGDSNPESEYAESCWKLQVMLRALGGED